MGRLLIPSRKQPTWSDARKVSRSRGKNSLAPGLWDGLVGLWSGVQGGGGDWFDLSGQGNHGALPTPSWETGPGGYAVQFDDSHQEATISELQLPGTLTAEIKFNVTDLSNPLGGFNAFLAKENTEYLFLVDDTTTYFRPGGVAHVNTPHGLSVNTEHTLVVTRDAANDVRWYRDGILIGGPSSRSGTVDTTAIGGVIGTADYTVLGRMYSAKIWNRALSPSEIQHLHDRPNDMLTPRPLQVAVSGAATGGPFPWYTGPNLSGNMQSLSGGI